MKDQRREMEWGERGGRVLICGEAGMGLFTCGTLDSVVSFSPRVGLGVEGVDWVYVHFYMFLSLFFLWLGNIDSVMARGARC